MTFHNSILFMAFILLYKWAFRFQITECIVLYLKLCRNKLYKFAVTYKFT
jgi:hypothetical protein